ncbi:MAG: TolC family protein [Acidobacteria bacterium]|nr:TolC family protein [Acidobacteriota bacterium]
MKPRSAVPGRGCRTIASTTLLLAAWWSCGGAGVAAAQQPSAMVPVLAAPGPGDAPNAAVRLTLPDAVARAMEASHRLGELRARGAGAEAARDGRQAAKLPQVAIQAGYQRTAHVDEYAIPSPTGQPHVIYPDIPDNFRTRLDFQWPIYTAGRLDALARAARAEVDASGKDLAAARNDLKLEVTRAFWAVVTARDAVRVVENSLAIIDAHLRDVRNRQQAGLVPPNDVLSTEAHRSRQHLLLIEARHAAESAAAEIRRLVGIDPDTPVEFDGALDQPAPPPAAAQALVDEARNARPDRQSLESRLAAVTARRDAAKAGKRPVIGVAAGLDYARPNPRIFPREASWRTFWDAGVNVVWTFWDGGRVAADVAEASASITGAEERIKEFDSVLEIEVRQRLLDLDSAQASVVAAADGIRAAAEARRVVEERFKAGVAINTESLDAQQALLQAELERTRALANVRLAEARLERALGR